MKNIAIIPNVGKDVDLKVTKQLVKLLKDKAQLHMEECFKNSGLKVRFTSCDELYENIDIVIVLGGDGTILQVAEPCAKRNIPVLGVNLGKIGFMTEINISEIESACDALLSNNFNVEKRMMIEASIMEDGKVLRQFNALNDVVVSKSSSPMILVEVHSMGEKINQYVADGLIISTPTGSTGYSLSAGGPVADPTMELFIASPICAHMLHARPALMPCQKPIVLSVSSELGNDAVITVDGKVKGKISPDNELVIKKSDYHVNIIKIGKQSFYDILIDKLR